MCDKFDYSCDKLIDMHSPPIKYENVFKVALSSRLVVFTIQFLAVLFIPRHENDGFKFETEEEFSFLDRIIHVLFGGFTSWDGQYFLHIVNNGYTHANAMAFFPLFPLIVQILSSLVHIITFPILAFSSTSIIVGFLLNLYLFCKCAETLYQLTKYYDFGHDNLCTMVVLLFCYNPASIFFSAFYSETLFAYLTFQMLLNLHRGNLMQTLIFASLSAFCRSNGILNLGFVFISVFRDILEKKKNQYLYEITFLEIMSVFFRGIMCLAGLLPFLLYQTFCYVKICDRDFVFPEKVPSMCISPFSRIQLPYSYIQSSNWDVGLFKYFEIKQIPNFLLATPVLTVLFSQCYSRLFHYYDRISVNKDYSYIPHAVSCFHGMALSIFCFLFIHVQVSTRMILSSCPYIYIFIAQSIRADIANFRCSLSGATNLKYSLVIYSWFLIYFLIGTIMFSTGYPWT